MTRRNGERQESRNGKNVKRGEGRIEERALIDVDRRVCVFSAAAGAAVCVCVLGCCSNALIHGGVRGA